MASKTDCNSVGLLNGVQPTASDFFLCNTSIFACLDMLTMLIVKVLLGTPVMATHWSLGLSTAADTVEILSAGYILSSYRREDGSDLSSTEKELLTAGVFVGMLVGGLGAGSVSDRMGRRNYLMVSLAVNFAFGALSAAAPSVWWLITARVCAGLGVGGAIPATFTLGAELFPTNVRGIMISLIASFWMVGSIFAATAAWIVLGDGFTGDRIIPGGTWRHYALAAALPTAMTLLLTAIFIPESPRFLAKAGRYKELVAVLRRVTNAPVELPEEVMIAPRPAPRAVWRACRSFAARWQSWHYALGGGLYHGVPTEMNGVDEDALVDSHVGNDHPQSIHGGVVHVLCSGDVRVRRSALVLVAVWFTLSYASNGISTWNNQIFADVGLSNPYLCSFIYALFGLPGNVGSIILVERIDRKHLLLLSMASAAAAIAGAAAFFASGMKWGTFVVFFGACLFNAFNTCGWNILEVVSIEGFPTVTRAFGMGLVSAAGRLGSIAAQFANGALEDNILALLLVTSGLTLLGGVWVMLLPRDTRGVALD